MALTLTNGIASQFAARCCAGMFALVGMSAAAGVAFSQDDAKSNQDKIQLEAASPGTGLKSAKASSSVGFVDLAHDNSLGSQIYMQARCFVCHGQDGFGGAGPRFRNNRFLGIADYVVGQILVGRQIMPSFADTLNDEQIAAVATYIRTSWGNKFGPVSPAAVENTRHAMTLQPQLQPEAPPPSEQPPGAPAAPHSPLPPGQAIPPKGLGASGVQQ